MRMNRIKKKYLVTLNIAGEIFETYLTARDPERAEMLARIDVAKKKGLIPSPWNVKPSDCRVRLI